MDDDRIREFVDHEYARVVATVTLVCGSVATAEDSVQEALARAWEQLARGRSIDRLPAWITTVALNLARSQMRRWRSERRARDRLGPLHDDLSNAPAASGDAYAVRMALLALHAVSAKSRCCATTWGSTCARPRPTSASPKAR